MTRLLHVSDLHFGRKNLPDQVRAIEAMVAREQFDAVAVSGDLTQRARVHEFVRARTFLATVNRTSPTIAVPGNHDCTWWRAPLHVVPSGWMFAKWRRHLGRAIEPVLRIPGATIVGLNTAHGIAIRTITRRPRDLSVIGDLLDSQIDHAARAFAQAASGDRRVIVMHHNPVAGELSKRFGFRHSPHVLREFAKIGVDLVLCGHDHQETAERVGSAGSVVVATAGTITTMSRGRRPTSVNMIELGTAHIAVRVMAWDSARGAFVAGQESRFEGRTPP